MKKEDLLAQGLNEEQIKYVFAENGKDIAAERKKLEKAESERDAWKEKAENAEATLKGFEGKDFDAMQEEINSWKRKAEEAEKDYNQKIADREKADLIKEAFADIKFTSESAKKAIMNQISTDITVRNGKLIGFNELLEEAKASDAGAFVNEQNEKLEQNKAQFTTPISNANGTKLSKADIMAVKDRGERRKLISENMELFTQ